MGAIAGFHAKAPKPRIPRMQSAAMPMSRRFIARSFQSGVDVDQGRPTRGLLEAVGHPDHRSLLESEHIAKTRREILEGRLLRRADVAEDSGQAELTQKLIGDLSHGVHVRPPPRVTDTADRIAHQLAASNASPGLEIFGGDRLGSG